MNAAPRFYRLTETADAKVHLQNLKVGGLTLIERLHRQLQDAGFVFDEKGEASEFLLVDSTYQYSLSFFKEVATSLSGSAQSLQFVDQNQNYLPVLWEVGSPSVSKALSDVSCIEVESLLTNQNLKQVQRQCEDFFFEEMHRKSEGLISKEINKRYSFAWSRYLAKTPITPNQITALTLVFGLLGSYFLIFQNYFLVLLGAFLLQFSSVLDGCDGEIAKLKVLSSKWGGWFDTVADDIVNMTMFVCLWWGWYQSNPTQAFYKFFLISTAARFLLSALMYVHRLKNKTLNTEDFQLSEDAEKQDSKLLYILKRIMKRDFIIFLAFVMILIGQPQAMSALLITCTWVAFLVIFIALFKMSLSKFLRKKAKKL